MRRSGGGARRPPVALYHDRCIHRHPMRTGAEYREALRDGRRVWVMGAGWVEDVTSHPATCAMAEEYAAWYDRHLDPEWQELLLAPPDAAGERVPWAYVLPRSSSELIGMGR